MAIKTEISWCDSTWNPITGCSPVSDGCKNCYARRMVQRFPKLHGITGDGKWDDCDTVPFGQMMFHKDRLNQPLRWKKPRRIFVCSMGDLFHEDVPFDRVDKVLQVILDAREHIFIILTKRPKRMHEYFKFEHPPKNVWLGVTAENQAMADERIPVLMEIPAAVRFVSIEPMLGPVDLGNYLIDKGRFKLTLGRYLDWVILGCETGPRRRSCKEEWMVDVSRQCMDVNVPVFVKAVDVGKGVSKAPMEWPWELMFQDHPEQK